MATNYQYETINHSRETALHRAIRGFSDPAVLQRLLIEKADINARDDEGMTALHLAARDMNHKVIQLLVDGNADINAPDSRRMTALHYLANADRCQTDHASVRLLLDKGADINAKDDKGRTALHLAVRWNPVVSLLLDEGADINAKDVEGKTVLHSAAAAGDQGIIRLLLSREPDINAKDEKQRTALHHFAISRRFQKDVAIVPLLVNVGIDINAKDDEGKTVLHSAAEAGNPEMVHPLLDSKANIDMQDKDGKTALHLVSDKGNIAMIRLLLDRNANIDMKDKDGKTALHLVAEKGNIEMVQLLLDNNATIDMQDNDGKTALHLVAEKGNIAMVRLMLTKRANRKMKDVRGHTALDLAIPRGDYWVKRLLDGSANEVCALAELDTSYVDDYLVIGLMGKRTGRPKEVLILNVPNEGLFKVIKQTINQLRPWWRSVFSLKSVQGFSVYECSPDHLRHHLLTDVQDSKQVEMNEFFQDYCQYPQDYGGYWKGVVWRGFSRWRSNKRQEADGDDASKKIYALQLVLRWSTTKIAIYGLFPILLSFAIGFWYQTTSGSDANAVKQTAWGIASYIITATALAMTLLAVITQLSDH